MIYLAPIQGITDRIFRNVFPEYFKGVDLAVAPFISTSKRKKAETVILRELEPEKNTGIPVIPQILSSDPDDFIPLADRLYDMGYNTVNWNLGCPFPVVVKKGKGAGMLCYPIKIERFLDTTLPRLKAGLSIKLRLGLVYPDEILTLIRIFNRYPLKELIIHPRTGEQMYEGDVNIGIFSECLGLSVHETVYNGDIDSQSKFHMLSERFPSIDKWMIGRGIISDPFLAEKIVMGDCVSYAEKLRILHGFHDRLFHEYSEIMSGPVHITDKMKGIWFYLSGFFNDSDKVRKHINKARNPEDYIDVVNAIFNKAIRADAGQ